MTQTYDNIINNQYVVLAFLGFVGIIIYGRFALNLWEEKDMGTGNFEMWIGGEVELLPPGVDPMNDSIEHLEECVKAACFGRDQKIFLSGVIHARVCIFASTNGEAGGPIEGPGPLGAW